MQCSVRKARNHRKVRESDESSLILGTNIKPDENIRMIKNMFFSVVYYQQLQIPRRQKLENRRFLNAFLPQKCAILTSSRTREFLCSRNGQMTATTA